MRSSYEREGVEMRSESRRGWIGCGRVKFSRGIGTVALAALLLTALLVPSTTVHAETDGPNLPPKNPYLADSAYAMSHGDSAQQDSTGIPGPTGSIDSTTTGPSAPA